MEITKVTLDTNHKPYAGREHIEHRQRRLEEQLRLLTKLEERGWSLRQIAYQLKRGYETVRKWRKAGESPNPMIAFSTSLKELRRLVESNVVPPKETELPRGGGWARKNPKPTKLAINWGLDNPKDRSRLCNALLAVPGMTKSKVCRLLALRRATFDIYLCPDTQRLIPPQMVERMVKLFKQYQIHPFCADKGGRNDK